MLRRLDAGYTRAEERFTLQTTTSEVRRRARVVDVSDGAAADARVAGGSAHPFT